jgi:AcrR family transcriptional regulator
MVQNSKTTGPVPISRVSPTSPGSPPERISAHDRLLEAAARVFARDGIEGATTRMIAREAGVNEVTLFRCFKSKDRLLAAVVGSNFGPQAPSQTPVIPPTTDDLRADLLELAHSFDRLIFANLPLVRTMLGEIQRYQEHERQVFHGIFYPLKSALRSRLNLAAEKGELRGDINGEILADLFLSMVFMGVLRRNLPHIKRGYSNHEYLQSLVDTTLRGALAEKKA